MKEDDKTEKKESWLFSDTFDMDTPLTAECDGSSCPVTVVSTVGGSGNKVSMTFTFNSFTNKVVYDPFVSDSSPAFRQGALLTFFVALLSSVFV